MEFRELVKECHMLSDRKKVELVLEILDVIEGRNANRAYLEMSNWEPEAEEPHVQKDRMEEEY